MSRCPPTTEELDAFKAQVSKLRRTREKLEAARAEAAKIPKLVEEAEGFGREITAFLERHDLCQRGNMGWEGRTIFFLLDLLEPPPL